MASTSHSSAKPSIADGGEASGSGSNKFGCSNASCDVGKIINAIPKRKTAQFITAPLLQEKPIFVNGLTSVFQIQGNAAKLHDIKPLNSEGGDAPKPIYRINPNKHVHVINYIVAEDECEVVRKISETDPETIRILQDSQRASAKQKLERLKSNHTVKDVIALVRGSGASANVRVTPLGSELQMLSDNSGAGKIKTSLRSKQAVPPPYVAPTALDQMQKELQELRQSVAQLTAQTKAK